MKLFLILLSATIAIPKAIKITLTQKAVANSLVEKMFIFLYSPLSLFHSTFSHTIGNADSAGMVLSSIPFRTFYTMLTHFLF